MSTTQYLLDRVDGIRVPISASTLTTLVLLFGALLTAFAAVWVTYGG